MIPSKKNSRALSATYFLFFAILGIFLPYFNLYAYSLKFSTRQIGVLSATLSLMKIASPLIWAHFASSLWTRKKISLVTSLASALLFLACLSISSFEAMLIAITLYGFFRTALVPMMEVTTWETVELRGGEYGKIRLWGSLGFIVTSLAAGWLLDALPLRTILYGIALLSVLLFINLFKVPDDEPLGRTSTQSGDNVTSLLTHPHLVLFFLIALLVQVSFGAYYGFYTIFMEEQGYSRSLVGVSWALSVLCEILLMSQYKRWFGRTRPQVVLIAGCFTATWRWWIMAHTESLVFILLAQATHAVCFGAFHIASLSYMNRHVPAHLRTGAQSLLNSLAYGLGGMIGFLLSGWLYEPMGATTLFQLSSFFSFAAGLLAVVHYFCFAPSKTGRQLSSD